MRSGMGTIQQTLTQEAANVLNQSIAEASRRSHSQTTPLHVAATLLASSSGYLRQACIRSHPSTSHPLQCRALELCFSVALDRLPSCTTTSGPILEPPISNALMAALKRAQAHQRRGCPEQQQQPLLAVKVELEQLIVSILDDPSVSRVMREASFSSPVVKAAIEQSITSTSSSSSCSTLVWSSASMSSPSTGGLSLRPHTATPSILLPGNWNSYNPRLHQHQQKHHNRQEEDLMKVLDVLVRSRKRNPVLVGDSEPEVLMKEVLQKIDNGDITNGLLKNIRIVNLDTNFLSDRSQIHTKISQLTNSVETKLTATGEDENTGVIVNLGDMKWLVDNPDRHVDGEQVQQQQQLVSEVGRSVVAKIGKMVSRFHEKGGHGQLWLIGTASCATYLRCQVYHPSMEDDWDLQAIPVAPRWSSVPAMFPRNGILSNCVESLAPHRGFVPSRLISSTTLLPRWPSRSTGRRLGNMCPVCTENYEKELAKLVALEFEKASSNFKPEVDQSLSKDDVNITCGSGSTIRDSLRTREEELKWKEGTEILMKRWNAMCLQIHPTYHQVGSDMPPLPASPSNLYNANAHPRKAVESRLLPHESICTPIFTNHTGPVLSKQTFLPESPVRTNLTLGQSVTAQNLAVEQNHRDHIDDLNATMQDFFCKQYPDNTDNMLDADSFKRLFKGLMEKISWQPEAASSVAITVARCHSSKGRSLRKKSDTWLLFLGPDRVGKTKMAAALSELLFGIGPMTVSLSGRSDGLTDCGGKFSTGSRRKMAIDQIAEAVRKNPFSVFVIEDISDADVLMRGRIKQAIESGRLLDSHGRDVSLGSAIFILIANSLPENLTNSSVDSSMQFEERIESIAGCSWKMELLVREKSGKRRGEELNKDPNRPTKARMTSYDGLSLDLNLGTGVNEEEEEEDIGDGSPNSSDLTVEYSRERFVRRPPTFTFPAELISAVDSVTIFKPVNFEPLCSRVSDAVISKFNNVMGSEHQLKIGTEALELIMSGIWFRRLEVTGFEDWLDKVLMPSFRRLRTSQITEKKSIVRLVAIKEGENTATNDRLPTRITIAGC